MAHRRNAPPAALVAAMLIAPLVGPARADARHVRPGGAAVALAAAAPGDTVTLAAGTHAGPLRVVTRVVLRGEPGAVVDGGGTGTAVVVTASGATVEDLAVRSSGREVMSIDAGVLVREASDVTLRRLRVTEVLYGVNAERATRLRILHCSLEGTVRPGDEAGNGNGIHLWYSDSARIEDCRASRFLDSIYLSFAHHGTVARSELADCGRYGLHTMYCQGTRLESNRFTRNVAGCAIMFSNHLQVTGNDFVFNRGARTYGLLLRDCSDGTFRNNRLLGNTVGLFMDNSNRNRFESNVLQDNGWGVVLFASCATNTFTGNNFIHNDYSLALDMRRTDNRFDDGARGNFWSENAAFDLDADGVGDAPFAPVSAFAFVSKQYPDLTVLAHSPAVAALGVAERVFPALRPSEALDRAPLVSPAATARAAASSPWRPEHRPAWGAALAFGATGLLALGGLAAVRRRSP